MCTRFFMDTRSDELNDLRAEAMLSGLLGRFREAGRELLISGEARPSDVVPVVAPDREGARAVFPMRWGFRMQSGSLLVNARSETAAVKPTFRDPWKQRRCAVPASWYFEWEHFPVPGGKTRTGDKFAIHPAGGPVTWLCGLYRIENGLPVFAVLTREPSEAVRAIHNRMPLILPQDMIDDWISPGQRAEDMLGYAVTDLVAERVGGAG